jgi:hypothetical protein
VLGDECGERRAGARLRTVTNSKAGCAPGDSWGSGSLARVSQSSASSDASSSSSGVHACAAAAATKRSRRPAILPTAPRHQVSGARRAHFISMAAAPSADGDPAAAIDSSPAAPLVRAVALNARFQLFPCIFTLRSTPSRSQEQPPRLRSCIKIAGLWSAPPFRCRSRARSR